MSKRTFSDKPTSTTWSTRAIKARARAQAQIKAILIWLAVAQSCPPTTRSKASPISNIRWLEEEITRSRTRRLYQLMICVAASTVTSPKSSLCMAQSSRILRSQTKTIQNHSIAITSSHSILWYNRKSLRLRDTTNPNLAWSESINSQTRVVIQNLRRINSMWSRNIIILRLLLKSFSRRL